MNASFHHKSLHDYKPVMGRSTLKQSSEREFSVILTSHKKSKNYRRHLQMV